MNTSLKVTVSIEGNLVFAQEVPDTKLLPKVMSEIMTSPQGKRFEIQIFVNGDPVTFSKDDINVRNLAMILNDLRLPIKRTKKDGTNPQA